MKRLMIGRKRSETRTPTRDMRKGNHCVLKKSKTARRTERSQNVGHRAENVLTTRRRLTKLLSIEAPNGYAAYRFAWNGDRFSQEIAVRALGSYLGNELHLKASLMSQVFKTSGVAKRPYGSAGGGCTVFVKYGSDCEGGQGKKIRYKFDQEEGDAVSHVLVGDFCVDPMCGLQGKQLGVLVGDVSMTVWNPSQRIAGGGLELRDSGSS